MFNYRQYVNLQLFVSVSFEYKQFLRAHERELRATVSREIPFCRIILNKTNKMHADNAKWCEWSENAEEQRALQVLNQKRKEMADEVNKMEMT